jgi:hypothetical protein
LVKQKKKVDKKIEKEDGSRGVWTNEGNSI